MAQEIRKATRDSYGETLVELGKENENIVVLDADLAAATKTGKFKAAFPERFFNAGIAEQNMMGVAAGLAAAGKTVFEAALRCLPRAERLKSSAIPSVIPILT